MVYSKGRLNRSPPATPRAYSRSDRLTGRFRPFGRASRLMGADSISCSGLLESFDVDRARELSQLLVRVPLLVERLLQELDVLILAQELGVRADRAVAGDLV